MSCAIGIGETRLLAKTATGAAKPGGIGRLTRRQWMTTMGAQPVTAIWGVGERTARRLADAGVRTIEELARADEAMLAAAFGPRIGPSLRVLGLGGGTEPIVDEPWVAKSRSKEVTYEHDLGDLGEIASEVRRLAVEVTDAVVAEGRLVTHVAVKVRTSTFFTRSKISKLTERTTAGEEVASKAAEVLGRFDLDGRRVRLLGVRVVLDVGPAD